MRPPSNYEMLHSSGCSLAVYPPGKENNAYAAVYYNARSPWEEVEGYPSLELAHGFTGNSDRYWVYEVRGPAEELSKFISEWLLKHSNPFDPPFAVPLEGRTVLVYFALRD